MTSAVDLDRKASTQPTNQRLRPVWAAMVSIKFDQNDCYQHSERKHVLKYPVCTQLRHRLIWVFAVCKYLLFALSYCGSIKQVKTLYWRWFSSTTIWWYSKTCLKLPLKKDKTKVLKLNACQKYCRMLHGGILQYFWPVWSDYYVPKPKGVEHIVFGADPVGVGVRVASFPRVIFWTDGRIFWPNLHRYTVGRADELIRFWWPWPNFQGHSDLL